MYICVKFLSKIVPTINIYWMVWWTESHLHSFSRGFKCRRRCYGEFRRTYRVSVSAHFPLNGHKNATRPKLSESVPSSSRGLRHPQSLSRLVFVAHFFPLSLLPPPPVFCPAAPGLSQCSWPPCTSHWVLLVSGQIALPSSALSHRDSTRLPKLNPVQKICVYAAKVKTDTTHHVVKIWWQQTILILLNMDMLKLEPLRRYKI